MTSIPSGELHPVRALLCTIPLDVGIPRGITNDPSRMVVMTGNLPVIPRLPSSP